MSDELLTKSQLSQFLGVATRTLNRMVKSGRLPAPLRLGHKTVRFYRKEVEAALYSLRRPVTA